MRKFMTFLLTLALIFSMGTTAFAAELDPTEIDVFVEYEENISGEYRKAVTDGGATINTDDGITVAVTSAPSSAVTLVVIPMEGAAKTWIDGCVDGSVLSAYDIHFLDADGNRINANGAKVSITASGSDLTVYSVNTNGDDKSLTANVSDGKVSFTTDGSHYYAITEQQTDDDLDVKTEVEDFGSEDVTDDLKDVGYNTVEKIETKLMTEIVEMNCGVEEDNTVMYDVVLKYSTDGGKTWQVADEEHFPADGKLLVSLPIPTGTDPDKHDYYVVHMFSKDAFGKKAGDVEYPTVTEHDGHIEFYVTGLSPILVGWVDTTSTTPEGHSFTNKASNVKATDATCTEAATYYVQCDNCMEHTTEKTVSVGDPLGHDWDDGVVTTDPTCEKDGVRTFTCKRDESHTYTKAEPATGHSFTKYESNNDATCKKDGTETAKCDHGCGETDTRTDKGSKLGHKYENGKCVRCGASQWIPETGDDSNIILWIGLMLISILAIVILLLGNKRRRSTQ